MSQYGMDGQVEDPDEMYRREMAGVRQAGAVAKAKRAQEGQEGVRGWVNKLPRNLTLGMYDAAVNTLRAPFDAADWIKESAADSLAEEGKRPKPAEARSESPVNFSSSRHTLPVSAKAKTRSDLSLPVPGTGK